MATAPGVASPLAFSITSPTRWIVAPLATGNWKLVPARFGGGQAQVQAEQMVGAALDQQHAFALRMQRMAERGDHRRHPDATAHALQGQRGTHRRGSAASSANSGQRASACDRARFSRAAAERKKEKRRVSGIFRSYQGYSAEDSISLMRFSWFIFDAPGS